MRHTTDPSAWRAVICLTAVALVLQNGCVTVAPPTPAPVVRGNLGTVAIVPAQYVPASDFVTFAKGKGAGAAKGAAIEGGATAAGTAVVAAVAAPIAVPVVVFAGIVAAAGMSVHGAVKGSQVAVPVDAAKQVESVINQAAAGLDAQNALAVRLATIVKAEPWIPLATVSVPGPDNTAARPVYAQLRNAGIDTVLEVAITQIGLESCGPEYVRNVLGGCPENPKMLLVDLFMSTQVRIVRVSDGEELFLRQFRYKSPRREIVRWAANDGRLLAEEFELAYRELAERMNDEVFLAAPEELPAPPTFAELSSPGNPLYGICWLAPVYPKVERTISAPGFPFSKSADFCPASLLRFTVIDTLHPTLRWSEFPRDLDRRRLDPAALQKISDVTYDLKIWQAEGCERGRLVYERRGLTTPEHPMEESLAPASRYFWSVRARFALDARPTATRWAHVDATHCFPNDIPDWQYHRFTTPAIGQ